MDTKKKKIQQEIFKNYSRKTCFYNNIFKKLIEIIL